MIPGDLVRGDVVSVTWVDIYEDVTGDPAVAQLAKRVSFGLYWGTSTSYGVPCIVTTTTLDQDVRGQSGFCIYPTSCVVDLKVVKRVRRPRARKPAALEAPRVEAPVLPVSESPDHAS